jgi:phosphonate transport system ATP-binding protein
MDDTLFELTGLAKVFQHREMSLEDVSLVIGSGERVAFIGASGVGKTTLFRILNLTLRPTAGTLRFAGRDVARCGRSDLRRLRRRVGMVYQQQNLVGWLRVVHNVLAGHLGRWSTRKALWSLVKPQDVISAVEALDRVGLAEKIFARTDTLSGGQQQRVAIARLLVQAPDVFLADEPVSSVDPSWAEAIVRLLVDAARARGKTLLMNLHSVELALQHFPRVVGMRGGRVFFDLAPEKITPDLLAELYAGAAADDATPAVYERAVSVLHGCRPV